MFMVKGRHSCTNFMSFTEYGAVHNMNKIIVECHNIMKKKIDFLFSGMGRR